MKHRLFLALGLVAGLATGCAPKTVVKPSALTSVVGPEAKLARARSLYLNEKRPAEAEIFIREAVEEYKASGNERGLAEAYHQYAYLLATWSGHLSQSIGYFDLASPIFARQKRFDRLTDNSVGRGIAYTNLKKIDEACASFDQSASFREEAIRLNPQARFSIPRGQTDWDAYLAGLKKWAGCGG